MKKRLNKAVMNDRLAHVAYDKQFKQQWKGVLDRRAQHEKAMRDKALQEGRERT